MISKNLKIYKQFVKNGFAYFTAYRTDSFFNLLINAFWIGMIFLIIEVIFGQTNTIFGWSKQEVYLLSMIWVLIDEISVLFFADNLAQISNLVANGTLDILLTKPLNSLFAVTFRYFLFRAIYRIIMESSIVVWILLTYHFNFIAVNIGLGIILSFSALAVNYAVRLIINTFSFWFIRIENINSAFGAINVIGKYPIEVFPKTLRVLVLTAMPIAFQAYIPTAAITGRWSFYATIYAIVFASVLLFVAIKFWNFAIKRYSSASS